MHISQDETDTILVIRDEAEHKKSLAVGGCTLAEMETDVARKLWLRKFWGGVKEIGLTDHGGDRVKRLVFLSLVFARNVTTVNDLNWAEVAALVAACRSPLNQPALISLRGKIELELTRRRQDGSASLAPDGRSQGEVARPGA